MSLIVEGNIACGKTTLINEFQKFNHSPTVLTLREPLLHWQNVRGINLLSKMYDNPSRWSFAFQIYVMLTMFKNHRQLARTKIMKRSLGAAKKVFLEIHRVEETMHPTEIQILQESHEQLNQMIPSVDIILYLKTTQESRV